MDLHDTPCNSSRVPCMHYCFRPMKKVGMEIYEPKLIVVIGRSTDFEDEFDRQQLSADNPDIEVVTYDDILTYANRRRLIIE